MSGAPPTSSGRRPEPIRAQPTTGRTASDATLNDADRDPDAGRVAVEGAAANRDANGQDAPPADEERERRRPRG